MAALQPTDRTQRPAASPIPHAAGPGHLRSRGRARDAARAAAVLREQICQGAIDLTHPRRIAIDGDLEHTIHLARRPERTFYGWLLHAMQSPNPWTLSMHVHVLDRAEMRARYAGRERRLAGLNEGRSEDGRRADRDQVRQEQEFAELIDSDLASGAETLCDVALYQSIRQPGPDPDARALHTEVIAAMRALGGVVDAQISRGELVQEQLWRSTLPLGLDVAGRTVRMVTRNVADSSPFVSTSSGSPQGIPFAFADPGRTVERLDPFDRLHDNGVMLVFAKSGGGKTATVLSLLTAALPRGIQANVIDRSTGHYRFACHAVARGGARRARRRQPRRPGRSTPGTPTTRPTSRAARSRSSYACTPCSSATRTPARTATASPPWNAPCWPSRSARRTHAPPAPARRPARAICATPSPSWPPAKPRAAPTARPPACTARSRSASPSCARKAPTAICWTGPPTSPPATRRCW